MTDWYDGEIALAQKLRDEFYAQLCALSYDGTDAGLADMEQRHAALLTAIRRQDWYVRLLANTQRQVRQRQALHQAAQSDARYWSGVGDVREERRERIRRAEAEDEARRRKDREERLERSRERAAIKAERARAAELWRQHEMDRQVRETRRGSEAIHLRAEDCSAHMSADVLEVPVEIAPVDTWYESETRLFRVAAVSNRAHGWLRPQFDRWSEGFQRSESAWPR